MNNNKNINNVPIQNKYKKLTPFKNWCLTNFPFIEADFDALTNYEFMSKIGGYLNDVINNENLVEEDVSKLYTAYTELQNYINNYFDNLDVQDEINNKIDELVESGELEDIIKDEKIIIIGDSYGDPAIVGPNAWSLKLIKMLGLKLNVNAWNFCKSGAGFTRTNNTYLSNLQNNESVIPDKTRIKKIIVCGGYNDRFVTATEIHTAINQFSNYIKTNYPNAQLYVGMIGYTSKYTNVEQSGNIERIRNVLMNSVLYGYKRCTQYNGIYLNGVEYIMHYYTLYLADEVHPNELGCLVLANGIYQSLKSGFVTTSYVINNITAGGINISNLYRNNKILCSVSGSHTLITPIAKNQSNFIITIGVPVNNNSMRYVNTLSVINGMTLVGLNDGSFKFLPSQYYINNDEEGSLMCRLYNDLIEKKTITSIYPRINNIELDPLNF